MELKFVKVLTLSIIFFFAIIDVHAKEKMNEHDILRLWDYPSDPYKIYKAFIWEHLFEKINTEHKTIDSTKIEIEFALACIYHDQAKFNKALPLLLSVYHSKYKDKRINERLLLIKLEETHRALGNFEKAIFIRQERINKKYINTYWEIYRDCHLFEAAKKDFLTFQQLSPKYTLHRLLQLMLLGDIYFQNSQFDSAKIIFQNGLNESIDYINQEQLKHHLIDPDLIYYNGLFIGNIATCLIQKGAFRAAIPMLLKDIQSSGENFGNKASKMIYLADALHQSGQNSKALQYLDSANSILTEEEYNNIRIHLYKSYANVFIANDNHKDAVKYFKKYNNLNDSIFHRIQENQSILLLAHLELNNRRNELKNSNQNLKDIKYQVYIKNITITLLTSVSIIAFALMLILYKTYRNKRKAADTIKWQNNELTAKTEALKNESLKNVTLLKEVHHRVKNNLQVISSLLNLQKRRQHNEATIQLLISIQNRIQAMALVHENLHTSGEIESINACTYIGNLINYLLSTFQNDAKRIDFQLEIDKNIHLPLEKMILIGLIVNEATSNALKYAFNEISEGIIKIHLLKNENEYHLLIQDNGTGLTHCQVNEKSLGLKLITFMTNQLNGSHQLINNKGVTHEIKF